jgi:hypothetical protein
MTSLTRIAYGSRVFRQGRSRPFRLNHAKRSASTSPSLDSGMEVRNVRWVGIRTDEFGPIVGFLRDVLGLRVNFEEPTTVEFTTSEDDGNL